MTKLTPLVGTWNAAVTFYDQDGVTEEVGTWSVSSVLDDPCLEFQRERHIKNNPRSTTRSSFTLHSTLAARGGTTQNARARTGCAATKSGCYPEASRASKPPD